MAYTSKRILCVTLIMLFLFSMFCTGVPKGISGEACKQGITYPGLFCLEYVRNAQMGTDFEQKTGRLFLQTRRRIPQRANSLRVSAPDLGNAALKKTIAPRELGVLCMMVFLTVIIYIFRSDGKKRVLL